MAYGGGAQSGENPAGPEQPDPSLRAYQKQIEELEKSTEFRNRLTNIKRWREYVSGAQHEDGLPGLVRTNIIFVNQATILPRTYAKNPELAIAPSQSVDPARYQAVKGFAESLRMVLDRMFIRDARLKKRMKAGLRSIMTTGEMWLKLLYTRDFTADPVVLARLQDTQDNIARLKMLAEKLTDPQSIEENELTRSQLQQQMAALQQNVEVIAAEGFALDNVPTEDMLILDPTIVNFDYYVEARRLCQSFWFTPEEYEEEFGSITAGTKGNQPTLFGTMEPGQQGGSVKSVSGKNPQRNFIRVREVWDKAQLTVYTFADGCREYCREPYSPNKLGERWYPFFRHGWNLLDGTVEPLSDCALQIELQDEYNRTRTHYAQDREDTKPLKIIRKGGQLTPEDVERIQKAPRNSWVPVEGQGGRPLSDDVAELKGASLDPTLYDTSQIRADMELVAGRGDADAGSIAEAKTATEAEILAQGLMTRSEERQDSNEDLITEMAQYAAEIALQQLSLQQVQRIAGPTAVWPELSKEEVFDLVTIEIRAGSSGKPNKNQEREQWLKLKPEIERTIMAVTQLRAQGQTAVADAMVSLLKETLRRFDERIDLDALIPPMPQQPMLAGSPVMQALGSEVGMPPGQEYLPAQPAGNVVPFPQPAVNQ
ncbi:MAG: hypothetical protein HMLKMBBP_01555 [Planctomycetes bacterium]|nr:hypothetical protein [Planctomycetota bacterium]